MKIKSLPIGRVKAGPEDGLKEGEFIVYPSTFTRKPDSYGDVVAKGAFAETIQKWVDSGNTLPGLYGHRMDDPDFFVAGASEMGEDDHGWWVKGAFDMESPKGPHVYRLVKGRRLNQLSFAYDTLEEGQVEIEDGDTANELRKLHVYEFSFVPIGANQDTSVLAVKGIADAIKSTWNMSTKSETTLREAQASLEDAAAQIKNVLSALDSNSEDGKAKPSEPAKDEEPTGAKSEEPMRLSPASMRLRCDLTAAAAGLTAHDTEGETL